MNVTGVPDVIEWDKVSDFLASIGIDPSEVCANSGGVVIGWDSIQCTVYATNSEGRRYFDTSTEDIAKHSVSIPITRHGHSPVVPAAEWKVKA